MISRIATTLFCTVAPAALFAQAVDLRSADEFISVEGEIVGFNGVMLQVATSVGVVSVPASEVICYGPTCEEVIASNTFGLTASAFEGIVVESSSDGQTQDVASVDTFIVGFGSPFYNTLYRTLSGAYAVANQTATSVEMTADGEVTLQSNSGNGSVTLTIADSGGGADISVQTVSLNGTQPAAYVDAAGWTADSNLTHQLIGLNAFSVIVAPNAGMTQITLNDLARIFAGEITNWSQIGGADVNILPLQMPPNTVIGTQVVKLVMEPAGKEIAGNILTMADEAGISASINQFPGSVSIVSSANANPDLVVDVAGSCGIAVAPTSFNILSGDYPLARPIMARYENGSGTALVTELFDFATTDVAQGLLEREGLLSNLPTLQDAGEKNARLSSLLEASLDDTQKLAAAQMFQTLFDADRMSPTLIGGVTSGPEGAWNRAMLLDLIGAMQDPANEGREIIFVGFGESTAGSEAAVAVSREAASEIQAELERIAPGVIAAGNYTVSSIGFGDVSPATCVDGQVTGSEYSRVEVWIR